MLVNHPDHDDNAAGNDGHYRHQQTAQCEKMIDEISHAPPPTLDVGGADRDRTGGLLVANQALSQLSYSPFAVLSSQMSVLSKTD